MSQSDILKFLESRKHNRTFYPSSQIVRETGLSSSSVSQSLLKLRKQRAINFLTRQTATYRFLYKHKEK